MKPYEKDNIPLAKKLRREQTEWERKFWFKFLRNYPVRFQRQKAIGEYIVDFYCAQARLIIELDGYYHGTDSQYKYDLERTAYLENLGMTVVRFKNSEIEHEFDRVCKQTDYYVKKLINI